MQALTRSTRAPFPVREVPGKHTRGARHASPGKTARRILVGALLVGALAAGSAAASQYATSAGHAKTHHQMAGKYGSPWMY
jgi:hypothetical protein